MVTINSQKLIGFVSDIFSRAGSSKAEADRIATYLTTANLTGHDSHGVIR
ncbi:MAG: malate dehydrogenase, partial [Afipia sp.]